MIELRIGSSGPAVNQLQNLLNAHLPHLYAVKVDAIFGPRTEVAVRLFQASVGIATDGVVGEQTRTALQQGITVDPVPHASANTHDAPWIRIATAEIGQKEFSGPSANPRILRYHSATSLRATSDEVAWCSAFVNWCLKEAGIAGTNSAAATSWLHWGHASGPRVGAITIMRKTGGQNHVAFYMSETNNYYTLLGGNQGDQVRLSRYYKSQWVTQGHRWPITHSK